MEIMYELGEIENAAKKFVSQMGGYKIFAFSGDLGAGKTTFIKAVCRCLGVVEPVTSPTYAIIQEYHFLKDVVYHIDLYRIRDAEEAIDAGVEDCLLSGELCMVEWPGKAPVLFPMSTVYISLQTVSTQTRKMIVQLPQ